MATPSIPRRETILMVDDEPMICRLVSEVLSQQGYKVLIAGNGNAALQIAEKHQGPIHLLIADILMPEMSGLELVPKIVARFPTIGVLYISDSDLIVRAFRKDLDLPFLPKPFSIEALMNTVGVMLFALAQKRQTEQDSSPSSQQLKPAS